MPRPVGSKNRRTLARARAERRTIAAGLTPLEYMLETMRDESLDKAERMDAAKAAAPFVHARLQATTIDDKRAPERLSTSDKELVDIAMAKAAAKAKAKPKAKT